MKRNPSRLLTRQQLWQQRFPERRRAHEAVRRALIRGELVKCCCEDCGTNQHVDAHHERYDRPLEVTWLCRKHHVRRHRKPKPILAKGGSPKRGNDASLTGGIVKFLRVQIDIGTRKKSPATNSQQQKAKK